MSEVRGSATMPAHVLTISGSFAGKIGSCSCGCWSVSSVDDNLSSDEVTNVFIGHLRKVGVARPACGGCDESVATARRGVVFRFCSGCELEDKVSA